MATKQYNEKIKLRNIFCNVGSCFFQTELYSSLVELFQQTNRWKQWLQAIKKTLKKMHPVEITLITSKVYFLFLPSNLLVRPSGWMVTVGWLFHFNSTSLSPIWDFVDLESTSRSARPTSCSSTKPSIRSPHHAAPPHTHTQPLYHPPLHHLLTSPLSPLCYQWRRLSPRLFSLSREAPNSWLRESHKVNMQTWPSLLRQNTQRGAGSTGWRRWHGNNNSSSESAQELSLMFSRDERGGILISDQSGSSWRVQL